MIALSMVSALHIGPVQIASIAHDLVDKVTGFMEFLAPVQHAIKPELTVLYRIRHQHSGGVHIALQPT